MAISVQYCGNCGLPPEFCEYGSKFASCKPWLIANVPHLYPQLLSPSITNSNVVSTSSGGGSEKTVPAVVGTDGSGSSQISDVASLTTALASASVGDSGSIHVDSKEPGVAAGGDGTTTTAEQKKSRRGGLPGGGKKPAAAVGGAVIITKKDRGRRKFVTTISGLDSFDIKLKEAASALGKRFGAGASIGKSAEGKPEIDVQGDVQFELPEILVSMFHIPEEAIVCKD